MSLQYLHTMIRVGDLDAALDFFCDKLEFVELSRKSSEKGRFTLVFLAAPLDAEQAEKNKAPTLELTYNWDEDEYTGGRNFGHLAYRVDDIYQLCQKLLDIPSSLSLLLRQWRFSLIKPFRLVLIL